MTMGLTPRQNDLYVYLLEREFEGRVAPTIDEMRDRLGVRSKSSVHRLVEGLTERGLIRRLPDRARAIEIVRAKQIARGFIVEPIPEVCRAIETFAAKHAISVKTAAEEALRAYFVGDAP